MENIYKLNKIIKVVSQQKYRTQKLPISGMRERHHYKIYMDVNEILRYYYTIYANNLKKNLRRKEQISSKKQLAKTITRRNTKQK